MGNLYAEEILCAEDMAIRNEDLPKIDELIQKALTDIRVDISALKPKGWRRLYIRAREAGALGIVIGAFTALLGITVGSIYREVSDVSAEATFRAHTEDRLNKIEDDLKNLLNIYSPLINAIGDPSSLRKQSPSQVAFRFKQAKLIITSAMESRVPTDPRLIEAATINLQNILSTIPLPQSVKEDGKSLLVRLDGYRAVTNDILEGKKGSFIAGVSFEGNGKALGAIAVTGDLNSMSDLVFFRATISDFTSQNLTAIRWVEATFKNDILVYNGGPLYLDSTRFIGCKYRFGSDPNSLKAKGVIESSNGNPVTLLIPSSENH